MPRVLLLVLHARQGPDSFCPLSSLFTISLELHIRTWAKIGSQELKGGSTGVSRRVLKVRSSAGTRARRSLVHVLVLWTTHQLSPRPSPQPSSS